MPGSPWQKSFAMVCLLAAALLALGCTSLARPRPSPAAGTTGVATARPTQATQPPGPVVARTVRFAAAPEGSEPYRLAQLVANVWRNHVPGLTVDLVASEGHGPNLRLLADGGADVVLVRDDLALLAANRLPPFSDRAIRVAALGGVYWEAVQILAAVDSGIATAAGLAGRRVAFPHWDSAATAMLNQVLGPGKLTFEDFPGFIQVPEGDAARALVENAVDVVMLAGPVPSAVLQQATAQRPVRAIALDDAWREVVRRQYPAFADFTLPAGTYTGQAEDAPTVAARTILAVRLDADEELTALLAQALVDGFADIADGSPIARDFVPEEVTTSVHLPFHPGAVQGYLSKGLFK